MAAKHCCVPLCTSDTRRRHPGKQISFHAIPKDESLRKMWLIRIRRDEGPMFKITNCTYVCSEHFTMDNFKKTLTGIRKLKEGTVPSVFQWNTAKVERPPPKKRPFVLENQEKHVKHTAPADGDDFHQPIPSQDHDYVTDPHPLTDAERLELSTQYIAMLEARLQTQNSQRFCIERFSTDEHTLNMYTGFKTYACLKAVFDSLQPTAVHMTRWSQVQRQRIGVESREDPFRCETLPLIDQFFLFLVRIRQGHNEHDLAIRFGVSTSTVSRLLITWVNYLYFMLGSLPIWPSRSEVNRHMPDCFRVTYPNTRVIVDCTELRAQTPSAKVLNSETYSNYKSHTTLKGLIGITPCGAISFVSSLHTGSISDKEITRVSGLMELIEVGDEVMADKGFLIQDLLQKVGAKVVIPPFLGQKGQFSKHEVKSTNEIARLRIHVERAIRRCKEYKIFDTVLPLTLAGSVNQIWTVCCLLTNFRGKLF